MISRVDADCFFGARARFAGRRFAHWRRGAQVDRVRAALAATRMASIGPSPRGRPAMLDILVSVHARRIANAADRTEFADYRREWRIVANFWRTTPQMMRDES
ncbi:hypothetical protein [Paraburkholderia sp. J41]|uniref:hypothetical protein n=1 Tax=Paraburkholderia sp. J41 TaxID=2805433 RepID=UPI002AC330E8|nr:hypothetical protein [Paraburkholderia sp. J41]